MKIENVKCSSCGANIKINKDGDTICPYCSAPFTVTEQDTKVIVNNTTINNVSEPKRKKLKWWQIVLIVICVIAVAGFIIGGMTLSGSSSNIYTTSA